MTRQLKLRWGCLQLQAQLRLRDTEPLPELRYAWHTLIRAICVQLSLVVLVLVTVNDGRHRTAAVMAARPIQLLRSEDGELMRARHIHVAVGHDRFLELNGIGGRIAREVRA